MGVQDLRGVPGFKAGSVDVAGDGDAGAYPRMPKAVVGEVETGGAANVADAVDCEIRADRACSGLGPTCGQPSGAGSADRNEAAGGGVRFGGRDTQEPAPEVDVFPLLPVDFRPTQAA